MDEEKFKFAQQSDLEQRKLDQERFKEQKEQFKSQETRLKEGIELQKRQFDIQSALQKAALRAQFEEQLSSGQRKFPTQPEMGRNLLMQNPVETPVPYQVPGTDISIRPEEIESPRDRLIRLQQESKAKSAGQFDIQEMLGQFRMDAQANAQADREQKWRAELEARQEHWNNMHAASMARASGDRNREISETTKFNKINQIVPKFFESVGYKSYRERNEAHSYAQQAIVANSKPGSVYTDAQGNQHTFMNNPGLWDLGLIYAFARGQDPNRVSDQELKLAMANAIPSLEQMGIKVKRLTGRAPLLTPRDRMTIANVIAARKQAAVDSILPSLKANRQLLEKAGVDDEEFAGYFGPDLLNLTKPKPGPQLPAGWERVGGK
jgi:hypothetical protein